MDKEVVVYIYNGLLLSHEKDQFLKVSSSEVDEPRVYDTEWSKSEREKQILHINTYIWIWKDGTDELIFRVAKEKQT